MTNYVGMIETYAKRNMLLSSIFKNGIYKITYSYEKDIDSYKLRYKVEIDGVLKDGSLFKIAETSCNKKKLPF